jgi:hypothetical protein
VIVSFPHDWRTHIASFIPRAQLFLQNLHLPLMTLAASAEVDPSARAALAALRLSAMLASAALANAARVLALGDAAPAARVQAVIICEAAASEVRRLAAEFDVADVAALDPVGRVSASFFVAGTRACAYEVSVNSCAGHFCRGIYREVAYDLGFSRVACKNF